MTWQLTLTGLLIGILVGLTGMGGGSLMTPILILVFGFNPTVAIGTDIAHGAAFKTVGAIRHRRLGNVQARLSGWMFLGSAPSSLAGVWLATWLEHRYGDSVESVSARVLGGALVFGCVGLLAKTLVRSKVIGDAPFVLTRRDRIAGVLIGLVGGFVVGLTSVGTGVFFGLTMLVLFPLRANKIVGTDIFHAAALLYVAGAGHLVAGNVDVPTLAWLLLGSIPGILIGSQLSVAIPDRPLRIVLAGVLGLSGLKLLDIPGTGVPIVIALAAGMTALLVWIGRQTWLRRQEARARRAAAQPAVGAAPSYAAEGDSAPSPRSTV
ncbi:MAG: sulfite exporter TauE/SafE family protein [Actinomycetota bacterium]|nr:sulfite exporter TauE/SafE family protein [Actinomycetota bacterium]